MQQAPALLVPAPLPTPAHNSAASQPKPSSSQPASSQQSSQQQAHQPASQPASSRASSPPGSRKFSRKKWCMTGGKRPHTLVNAARSAAWLGCPAPCITLASCGARGGGMAQFALGCCTAALPSIRWSAPQDLKPTHCAAALCPPSPPAHLVVRVHPGEVAGAAVARVRAARAGGPQQVVGQGQRGLHPLQQARGGRKGDDLRMWGVFAGAGLWAGPCAGGGPEAGTVQVQSALLRPQPPHRTSRHQLNPSRPPPCRFG